MDKLDALTKGKADSDGPGDGKLSQILIHTSEKQTKFGDLGSDVTSLKSGMEFINTAVQELKSSIENKVDKQVFEVYNKDAAQKIDDLEKRFGDYKAEALAMFTLYRIVKRSVAESVPDRASVYIRNAAFEAVSAPEQYCSAPLLKVERSVSDRFLRRSESSLNTFIGAEIATEPPIGKLSFQIKRERCKLHNG